MSLAECLTEKEHNFILRANACYSTGPGLWAVFFFKTQGKIAQLVSSLLGLSVLLWFFSSSKIWLILDNLCHYTKLSNPGSSRNTAKLCVFIYCNKNTSKKSYLPYICHFLEPLKTILMFVSNHHMLEKEGQNKARGQTPQKKSGSCQSGLMLTGLAARCALKPWAPLYGDMLTFTPLGSFWAGGWGTATTFGLGVVWPALILFQPI